MIRGVIYPRNTNWSEVLRSIYMQSRRSFYGEISGYIKKQKWVFVMIKIYCIWISIIKKHLSMRLSWSIVFCINHCLRSIGFKSCLIQFIVASWLPICLVILLSARVYLEKDIYFSVWYCGKLIHKLIELFFFMNTLFSFPLDNENFDFYV